MNRKRVSCILLSLLLGSSVVSFADIPEGTVVIDNKAYDIKYANKKTNLKEIYTQFKNSTSEIYVKALNGKWYKNSDGTEISKELIPQVIYKGENGKVFEYSAQDGAQIELAAEKVDFISDNQVKIQFNKKMMEESVLNKSNYKIGERDLSENDSIDLQEDGKTVVITLAHKLEGKIIDTSIFISEKILDINNSSMNNNVTKNILVINDKYAKLDKEINKDINVILDNYSLNDVKINGDIYINANNVKVNKIVSSGNIIINHGEKRKTQLLNSKFKKVDVLSSGKESVTLSGIKADTLRLNSKDGVRVTAKGSTKINNTIIQSGATLERVSGSLGEVKINIDKDKESESLVELKGKFKDSIIMESGARLSILQGAEVDKLDVRPFFRDSIVSIEGAVKNVEVNRECVLNILKRANITNEVVVNCKSRLNGEKGAKVKKLNISPKNKIDKINISGEFKEIEISEEANIHFDKNTIVHKLVAYKNAILNGDNNVDIKKIQADKGVEIKKENNNVNKDFNLPNIDPIKKSSDSTYSGGGSWNTVSNSKPEAKNIVISGELKVGQEITADYEYYDKDSDKEGSSTFKWYRSDDSNGTNKTEISNEKSKTYTLTNGDKGKYIAFEVTPIAKSGEKTGTAVMSNFVGPVEEVVVEDTEKPVITLKGSKSVELQVGDLYEDAGATALDNVDGDITNKIVITITDQTGNKVDGVDTTKSGKYTISYAVSDNAGNKANEVTRTVTVKEVSQDVSVKIEVNGHDVKITVEGEQLIDQVSIRIVNKETGALVDANSKYPVENKVVFDSRIDKSGEYTVDINPFNNGQIIKRDFTIQGEKPDKDTVKPSITLKGKKKIELEVGADYEDAGATALDNVDGDITDKIVTTITDGEGNSVEKVDTTAAGQYTIHYNVSDEAGNEAEEVTRTVIVNEKEVPDTEKPVITLNGMARVELETGDLYEDAGATAVDDLDGDITDKIVMTVTNEQGNSVEKVDTTTAGEYTVHYNVSDKAGNEAEEVTRTVIVNEKEVPDTEKPVITLNGTDRVELETGDVYEDAGATAVDNVDGDITDKIVTTITDGEGNSVDKVDTTAVGQFKIHYNVSDQAGNTAEEVTRTVIVNEKVVPDTEKPVITLNGRKIVELEVGDIYEDAGATAMDNVDGNITDKIGMTIIDEEGKVVEKVDTAIAGEYAINYDVSDAAGNVANRVTRYVIVKEVYQEEPVKVEVNGYNVKITVEGENLKDSVSVKIINNKSEAIEDIQTKSPVGNRVVFERRIEKAGEFTAYINAFKDGERIEKTFTIQDEDPNNDTVKPILTLQGNSYIELEVGDIYEDAGATALDNVDGDITDNIIVTILDENGREVKEIDTTKKEVYTIYYSVRDNAGNAADSIKRNVIVKEAIEDKRVQVDVNGYNVKITVEGEDLKDSVSLKIKNKETGEFVDAQTKASVGNKVVFDRRIEKTGEFIAYVNGFEDGEIIEKTFTIKEEPSKDTIKPVITLKGNSYVELEIGDVYKDAGATAVDNVDGDITDKIVVTMRDHNGQEVEKVDTTKAGQYSIHYNVSDKAGNGANELTRTVIVKEVAEEGPVKVEVDGYNVTITVEGEDLKDSVSVKIINSQTGILEDIQTKSPVGNKVVFVRRIEKTGQFKAYINAFKGEEVIEKTFTIKGEDPNNDTVKPIITLKGNSNVELKVGDVYEDAGATAVDNVDGDITNKIVMTIIDGEGKSVEKVDTSTSGKYTIHYNVSDKAGNAANELTRTVIVKEISQDEAVKIEIDGYNVKITVEGENLRNSVSIIITNKETGELVDVQQKSPVENKVVFERRIEESGEFTANIKAYRNGDIIQKDFRIN